MKSKLWKLLAIGGVVVFALAAAAWSLVGVLGGTAVTASKDDIDAMVEALVPYGIATLVVLAAVVAALFVTRKSTRKVKTLTRGLTLVGALASLVIAANLIAFGPVYGLLSLSFKDVYKINTATLAASEALGQKVVEEGAVLLKNANQALPLKEAGQKLNVFGWSSVNPVYGGTGSGGIKAETCVTLLQGLKEAGFQTNVALSDFYSAYAKERPIVGMGGQDWTVPEPRMDDYEAAGIFQKAKEFSETALVVISRSGGENADLPTSLKPIDTFKKGGMFGWTGVRYSSNADDLDPTKHYLELSNRELAMVKRVSAEFAKVIVVVNSANPMELGWIDEYPHIDGVLWCAGPGQTGFRGLGQILSGSVNPSGRLVDTYLYDLLATPVVHNFGNFQYDNMAEMVNAKGAETKFAVTFVNYVEGIYVGYKFYETAAAEGLIDYRKTVQFPFGYGLSYGRFDQKITDLKDDGSVLQVTVQVTNTGTVRGKDVVELYFTPPYTNGGIEKSAVNLLDFTKTQDLEPGATEAVTFTVSREKLASYDSRGQGGYLLEHGDYNLSIRSDSHTVLDSRSVSVPQDLQLPGAQNQFTSAAGTVTYLSRANHFANFAQAVAAPTSFSMAPEAKAGFLSIANYQPQAENNPSDTMPTLGARNGLQIRNMVGLAYDDPKWDALLDELTVDDMNTLIAFGGYSTAGVASIGLPKTVECDGPASIYNNFNGQGGTAFSSPILLAAAWNKDLARQRGSLMGKQCDEMRVSGWYAPAMNIHRSAFAGRNFEYYSEDGVLSGATAAQEIKGAAQYKVATYIKHFALNDQEQNRKRMLCTWTNEQAMREIYLKPFEIAVKEGGTTAVMSSFNYIGNRFAGASPALLQTVLRGEWGFRGVVVTDWFSGFRDGYMDADQLIRAGNDRMLSTTGQSGALVDDTKSATSIRAMRSSAHNILYSLARSNAMDDRYFAMPTWITVAIGVDILVGLILVGTAVFLVFRARRLPRD